MNSLTSIHQMQDKFGVATNAVKAFEKTVGLLMMKEK